MIQFVELVIPIQDSWLRMLDRVALPVVQILDKDIPYFLTNDEGKVMRLRVEKESFEKHKDSVYQFLIDSLQSDEKVQIYKQNYALEEARFGKVKDVKVHTDMFCAASELVIRLLEEAEHIDVYENRMPYAVVATFYLLNNLNKEETQDLCKLYIRQWMFFNEHADFKKLIDFFEETYSDEAASLSALIEHIDSNPDLVELFSHWSNTTAAFIDACSQPKIVSAMSHRHKTFYYRENQLENARVWEIIADHIHLLYNRFGMENEDETLLIYLTMKAMHLT